MSLIKRQRKDMQRNQCTKFLFIQKKRILFIAGLIVAINDKQLSDIQNVIILHNASFYFIYITYLTPLSNDIILK